MENGIPLSGNPNEIQKNLARDNLQFVFDQVFDLLSSHSFSKGNGGNGTWLLFRSGKWYLAPFPFKISENKTPQTICAGGRAAARLGCGVLVRALTVSHKHIHRVIINALL